MKYLKTFDECFESLNTPKPNYPLKYRKSFYEPKTREEKMDFIMALLWDVPRFGPNPKILKNLPIGGIDALKDLTDEAFEDFYQSIKPKDFRVNDPDNHIEHFHKRLYNPYDHVDNVFMRDKYGDERYPKPVDDNRLIYNLYNTKTDDIDEYS